MPTQPPHAAHDDVLPVSTTLELLREATQAPESPPLVDVRVLRLCALAIGLGIMAAFVAKALVALIALITNLAFFGRLSLAEVSPAENQLGLWVMIVPVVGALIIGVMARYGSKAIRGHGIPEAMEQVLTNKSRIPARITILKPLSAAISIGTGGPFGAEGPIIATGGALGSVIGQLLPTTPTERKTLLAAGAAAGMTAIFGSPLSALLLAIELLLFEFRPRSLIPVALAAATAAGMRTLVMGTGPVFESGAMTQPGMGALIAYVLLGAVVGLAAKIVTQVVYAIEDTFEKLPIHWMWWPAIGAIAVGVVGYFAPRTLGVGYENISDLIQGKLALGAIVFLCTMKFISWSIALGSGTSGGTLAPLLTIGGGLGAVAGLLLKDMVPDLGVDPGLAALVGMASMFSGATRAPLASAVFAFETTMQPLALLPLLGGSVTAYLVSCGTMANTIMTEKIARRGVKAPDEYVPDLLGLVQVQQAASKQPVCLQADDTIAQVRVWLASGRAGTRHQGFPVLDVGGTLIGVLTQRDLRDTTLGSERPVRDLLRQPVKFIYNDCVLRQAVEHMLNHDIGRLPVVSRNRPTQVVGMLTRSDILAAQRHLTEASQPESPTISLRRRAS